MRKWKIQQEKQKQPQKVLAEIDTKSQKSTDNSDDIDYDNYSTAASSMTTSGRFWCTVNPLRQ